MVAEVGDKLTLETATLEVPQEPEADTAPAVVTCKVAPAPHVLVIVLTSDPTGVTSYE